MTNKVAVYDLRCGVDDHTKEEILKFFDANCKRWCFQLEKGLESGYVHFQCRVSFSTKMRLVTAKRFILSDLPNMRYIAPTSANANKMKGGQFYVMKEISRVEGPWKDTDPEPVYMQKRFREASMYIWQKNLRNLMEWMRSGKPLVNDRHIVMVIELFCAIEDNGNIGKSWLKGYLTSSLGNCIRLPSSMSCAKEMIQFLTSHNRIYTGGEYILLMDVPRATSPKHWWTLSQGLEEIKQGFLYDPRYSTKEITTEPMQICCFMNNTPPANVMSRDVFRYWSPSKHDSVLETASDYERSDYFQELPEVDCGPSGPSS